MSFLALCLTKESIVQLVYCRKLIHSLSHIRDYEVCFSEFDSSKFYISCLHYRY